MSRLTPPLLRLPLQLLKGLISRYPTAAFLLLAYLVFWTTLLPAYSNPGLIRPLSIVGSVLGMALPALLVSAATGGVTGARHLLRRCLHLPARFGWSLTILFGLPLATILLAVPFLGPQVLTILAARWLLLLTSFVPQVLLAFVTIQLWEEAAWAGFVQNRLQDRYHPLKATILVAVAFAWIHLPTYLVGVPVTLDRVLGVLLMMIPVTIFAVFFRILLAWAYNASGKSVPAVALLHATFNTISGEQFARHFIPGPVATWLPLVAVVVAATVALVVTRGHLAYPPDQGSHQSSEPAVGPDALNWPST